MDPDTPPAKMPDSARPGESGHHWKREAFKGLMKDGVAKGKEGLAKGTLMVEHSLGLGQKPNVIPPGEAVVLGEMRNVEIGWHPVMGLGGKWFAEKTGLGRMITDKVHSYPDPSQHWAVLVGDYCHELWMDEHLNVIYLNEKINRDEWHTFEVGQTRFNDEALRQAGEMVIYQMREKRPGYNLISNNCQNFAVFMLDAVQVGSHRDFGTTFAIYQRATGKGRIKDLFADEVQVLGADQRPPLDRKNTAQVAQQVMNENTTKLDSHHQFSK